MRGSTPVLPIDRSLNDTARQPHRGPLPKGVPGDDTCSSPSATDESY